MNTRYTALWLSLALTGAAARGIAQQAPQAANPSPDGLTYAVWGTVVDHDGAPVATAEVRLVQHDTTMRVARTDADGHFRMDSLTSMISVFQIRRLGYQPKIIQVRFTKSTRSTTTVISLESAATALDTVLVEADTEVVKPDSRLMGFYERSKSNNFGHYITEEMLAKLHPHFTSDAVRTVPGVIVRPARRIGNTVRLRNCGTRGESSDRAGPLVWVDGVRLPGAELDEFTQGGDVAAIEIYNSFAGIPVQYFDRTAVCGTILVWTKSR